MRSLSLALALSGVAATGCDPGAFRSVDTGTSNSLRSVFTVQGNRILSVGDKGTILQFDGETITDTSTDADPGPRIPSLYGVVSSRGFDIIAGDTGVILQRSDKDFAFDDSRRANEQRLLFLMLAGETSVYSGGESGRFLRKEIEGTEWERVGGLGLPGAKYVRCHNQNCTEFDEQECIAAPLCEPVYDPPPKLTAGWAANDETIKLVTDKGTLVELVDGDWETQEVKVKTATVPLPLFGVWSEGPDKDVITVGLGGMIHRRDQKTGEWSLEDTKGTQDLYGIFGTAANRIFAVGAQGTILRFDGTEWKGVPSGTSEDLFAVHGLKDGSVTMVVGARGTMLIFEE